MHILQPKHSVLKKEEAEKLLASLNVDVFQLPKMRKKDPMLPKDIKVGDIIKIERISEGKKVLFYRVVVP